jgi:energy-coupling factor transport system permease protein
MKAIAFGQYYPTGSVLHRLDPRIKILMAFLYVIASFLGKNVLGFAMLLTAAFALILISKIPLGIILKSVRPIIFIMLFTMIINIFLTRGDTVLVEWRFIHIYTEGIYNAIFMTIRIFVLVIGMSILMTYTTTPIVLTDAIERLLSPLKQIVVPVQELATMMTTALRVIPTLVEDTEKIMAAQKARGADFTSGSLLSRAKALIPILVPLFASAFRRAEELATAMECRCYHGGDGRTRMTELHYHPKDFLWFLLTVSFCVLAVSCNYFGIGYTL